MSICIDGLWPTDSGFDVLQASGVSSYHDLIHPCCQAISNTPESWKTDIHQISLMDRIVLNGCNTELLDVMVSHRVITLSAAVMRRGVEALKNPSASDSDPFPEQDFRDESSRTIVLWSSIVTEAVEWENDRYRGLAQEYLDSGIISLLGQFSLSVHLEGLG